MNLKNAIGLVAHKLLDWKTVTNPVTRKFYPNFYSIRRLLPSFRKRTVQVYFMTPYPSLVIDHNLRSRLPFSPANIAKKFFYEEFASQYPHNEKRMVDSWIFQLKLMMNYFSGFGNILTQDSELNRLAYSMRKKITEYRQKRFETNG
jgi:hypothetical protein